MNKKLTYDILVKPVITEKSLKLVDEENQYTFEVAQGSNKQEVKKAVEAAFKVTVLSVRIKVIRGKRLEWGKKRIKGERSGRKEAMVKLKSSDTINLFKVK